MSDGATGDERDGRRGADADDATMADLAALLGSPTLDADERAAVLDLTRVVAHTVQRRFGPLAAYSLGLAAGDASADDRTAALRAAVRRLEDRADEDGAGGVS